MFDTKLLLKAYMINLAKEVGVILLIGSVLFLTACAQPAQQQAAESVSLTSENGFDQMEIVTVQGHKAFIRHPAVPSPTGVPQWVWYAPTFLNGGTGPTPMPLQVGFYFDEMSKAGITVVGMDIGESFGSPEGRDLYESFYQYLQVHGYAQEGCMILQSRGGLMGYNWLMDHPGRVKCVAGIYPLVTVTDYVGISGMAPAWGVTEAWLTANLTKESPLERHDPLHGIKVLHLHGDADGVVHLNFDQQFISQVESGIIRVVPGEGHEFFSWNFFHNQELVDFLKEALQ